MNAEKWENLTRLKVFDWAERNVPKANSATSGFSFHDDFEVFGADSERIRCLGFLPNSIQNYMDVDYQAGRKGLQEAAIKGAWRGGHGAFTRRSLAKKPTTRSRGTSLCPILASVDAGGMGTAMAVEISPKSP